MMKQFLLFSTLLLSLLLGACEKETESKSGNIPADAPRTPVPGSLQGLWMHGNFSTREYFGQNPSEMLGAGFTAAFAFKFNADGTYEEYFIASAVTLGTVTYHQSASKGTVEVDEASGTIITHPYQSHYKRTKGGKVEEDRDMKPSEISGSNYTFEQGTEPNGTRSLYMKLGSSGSQLKFLYKG